VYQEILTGLPDAPVEVFYVWVRVYAEDELDVAEAMSHELADPRAHHYWDAPLALGADLVPVLDIEPMAFAWDVYMFFDEQAHWEGRPPAPADWVHFMNGIRTDHYCPPSQIESYLADKAEAMGLARG